MPTMQPESVAQNGHDGVRLRAFRALPWLWFALCAIWLVVVLVTELLAWTLAIWIGTVLGSVTMLQARLKPDRPATGNSQHGFMYMLQ
jgi:Flp pilus assembly protein TadB